MAKKVFFSFHYEDVKDFRVNVVRNSWVAKVVQESGFVDGSLWEEARLKGRNAIKKLIDEQGLFNTSATAVLIGTETHKREWVKYEIVSSFERGNAIIGIHLNQIKNRKGEITEHGINPLTKLKLKVSVDGKKIHFFELYGTKRWVKYKELPIINNRKANTVHFQKYNGILHKIFGKPNWGKEYLFSDLFPTYCWVKHDGYNNFSDWVNKAVNQ